MKVIPDLYFGFEKKEDFFIAVPEKALLDAVYLNSFGRYSIDLPSVDINKIEKISRPYPHRTLKLLRRHGYLQTT